MINLGKYKKFEFKWKEFEREFLPHLLETKASLVFYQSGKLIAANEYFFDEFNFQEREFEKVDALLWNFSDERQRFFEKVNMVLAGEKIENGDFLLLS